MTFELSSLFAAGVGYLLLLFAIAYAVDRDWVPRKLVHHPAVYVLSLGVYATSWSFYGSVGFAEQQGFLFLTIYLGVTLAFVLTPVLLAPMLRLTREYQLSSLADLFTFRYRSQWVGVLVTLFMLAGTLPYIALQIRAVTESIHILTQEAAPDELALGFCLTLTAFAVLFGARHTSAREKHHGLVVAIAFESLVKLTALLAAGLFAVYGVFGGLGELNAWLTAHPQAVQALYQPVREGPWQTLLFLSFCAAFLLPRQFHMIFTENFSPRALSIASWGFPLFLLLLNLAIPPILWAGSWLQSGVGADYYVLGITLAGGNSWLPALVFIGGISAASAMMIVTTLALSAMCLNHLLLPASYPDPQVDLYRWLLWGRRMIIGVIIMAGYGFYLLLEHNRGLVQLGLISFVAVAQFLPGVVGLLYWRRATRYGLMAGLSGGAVVWTLTLLFPLLADSGLIDTHLDWQSWMQRFGQEAWSFATFWSLLVNGVLFVAVSLLTRQSRSELEAAHACCRESLTPPPVVLTAASPAEFEERLARIIGPSAAALQVRQALEDLSLDAHEHRPAELARLRERIERNLSGLVGPLLADLIVEQRLSADRNAETALATNVRFIEQQLEASNTRLQGLAAELDRLRRYHRRILHELPLGVCSVGPGEEIVTWNMAMEILSGVARHEAVGMCLSQLPEPWDGLLHAFLHTRDQHIHKQALQVAGRSRWFNLHKASFEEAAGSGSVLLMEDLTEVQTLESELAHSERLASIGRLAAGVAHEIGNPLTGIACLAQNMREEDTDSELAHESVEQILEQTRRISAIVESLVNFSHPGIHDAETGQALALRPCLEDAARLMQLSEAGRRVTIDVACDGDLLTRGERQRLVQVLVNLLSNACDASPAGAVVRLRARAEGDWLELEVLDRGQGIPQEIHERIFEPFVTSKPAGQGTGLGLAVSYSIVQHYGGELRLEARAGGGTRALVRLPRVHAEEASEPLPRQAP